MKKIFLFICSVISTLLMSFPIAFKDMSTLLLTLAQENYITAEQLGVDIHAIEKVGKLYVYKGNDDMALSRVYCANKMRECIKEYGLISLEVPQKYIYMHTDSKYAVFAQKITKGAWRDITLAEAKQLALLVEKTYFFDFDGIENVVITDHNTIAFLDTEYASFKSGAPKEFLLNKLLHGLPFTNEAYDWLERRIHLIQDDPDCPITLELE